MQVIRCFKNVTAQRNIKSSARCSLKRRLERHAGIVKNIKMASKGFSCVQLMQEVTNFCCLKDLVKH